ncbi:MAG: HTTM domain-containing protein, partial [Myxococcota bacterium]
MTASLRDRFGALLFTQVDIASLVVFRIAFGLLMAWEGQHLLASGAATEWMGYAYRFSYPGFSWVRMWPGEWIYLHVYALAALGLCIAAGFLYRAACALFAVGFAWIFLLDEAFYLNHFYLICLMSAGMALLPAHRAVSVDAWLRPSLRSETIPAWPVWLLRAQMGFVYFFGGIAKLDAGWLSGSVMAGVLPNLLPYPYVQDLWAEPWFAVFLAWGGLLLDLFVVPALLWRPTRYWALAFATGFHLANHAMWNIGVFPWLAIAATLVFLDPDWPRRVFNWPRRGGIESPPFAWTRERRVVAGLFAAYLLVHVLLPLRPLLRSDERRV